MESSEGLREANLGREVDDEARLDSTVTNEIGKEKSDAHASVLQDENSGIENSIHNISDTKDNDAHEDAKNEIDIRENNRTDADEDTLQTNQQSNLESTPSDPTRNESAKSKKHLAKLDSGADDNNSTEETKEFVCSADDGTLDKVEKEEKDEPKDVISAGNEDSNEDKDKDSGNPNKGNEDILVTKATREVDEDTSDEKVTAKAWGNAVDKSPDNENDLQQDVQTNDEETLEKEDNPGVKTREENLNSSITDPVYNEVPINSGNITNQPIGNKQRETADEKKDQQATADPGSIVDEVLMEENINKETVTTENDNQMLQNGDPEQENQKESVDETKTYGLLAKEEEEESNSTYRSLNNEKDPPEEHLQKYIDRQDESVSCLSEKNNEEELQAEMQVSTKSVLDDQSPQVKPESRPEYDKKDEAHVKEDGTEKYNDMKMINEQSQFAESGQILSSAVRETDNPTELSEDTLNVEQKENTASSKEKETMSVEKQETVLPKEQSSVDFVNANKEAMFSSEEPVLEKEVSSVDFVNANKEAMSSSEMELGKSIEVFEQENRHLKTELIQLQTQLQNAEDQKKELVTEHQLLVSDHMSAKNKLEALRKENDQLCIQVQEAERGSSQSKTKSNKRDTEVGRLKEELNKLEKQKEEILKEKELDNDKITKMQDEKENLKKEVGKLTKDIALVRREVTHQKKLNDDIRTSLEASVRKHRESIEKLEAENARLQKLGGRGKHDKKAQQELEKEVDYLQEKIYKLTEEKSQSEINSVALYEQIDELKQKCDILQQKYDVIGKTMDAVNMQNKELKEKNKELQERIDTLTQQNNQIHRSLDSQEAEESIKETDDNGNANGARKITDEHPDTDLENVKDERNKLQQMLDKLQVQHQELHAKYFEVLAKNEELDNTITKQKLQSSLKNQQTISSEEYARQTQKIGDLVECVETLKITNLSLTNLVQQKQAHYDQVNNELMQSRENNRSLTKKVHQFESEKDNREVSESQLQDIQAAHKKLLEENRRLKTVVAHKSMGETNFQTEKENLKSQLDATNTLLDRTQAQLEMAGTRIQKLEKWMDEVFNNREFQNWLSDDRTLTKSSTASLPDIDSPQPPRLSRAYAPDGSHGNIKRKKRDFLK